MDSLCEKYGKRKVFFVLFFSLSLLVVLMESRDDSLSENHNAIVGLECGK